MQNQFGRFVQICKLCIFTRGIRNWVKFGHIISGAQSYWWLIGTIVSNIKVSNFVNLPAYILYISLIYHHSESRWHCAKSLPKDETITVFFTKYYLYYLIVRCRGRYHCLHKCGTLISGAGLRSQVAIIIDNEGNKKATTCACANIFLYTDLHYEARRLIISQCTKLWRYLERGGTRPKTWHSSR